MEYLAFYLFHFPSTHRNYKHLVYGDMNFFDWTGTYHRTHRIHRIQHVFLIPCFRCIPWLKFFFFTQPTSRLSGLSAGAAGWNFFYSALPGESIPEFLFDPVFQAFRGQHLHIRDPG